MKKVQRKIIPCRNEQGTALIEFSILALLLFTLVFGIMDFGRILFIWNSAAEATRAGARIAIVSPISSNTKQAIDTAMQQYIKDLTDAQISLNYSSDGAAWDNSCTANTCQYVQVGITGYQVAPIFPIGTITLPSFTTTLPRESMGSP